LSIQPNSDAQSLASSISSDYAAMESSLAFSIGIGLNRSLRSRLRALAGASDGQAIFVSHLQKGAWLEIDPQGIGYRAPPKARRVTFDRPRASGDARTGARLCG